MPQLIPFFFVNQVLFNFALLTIIIYIFTKYLKPVLSLNLNLSPPKPHAFVTLLLHSGVKVNNLKSRNTKIIELKPVGPITPIFKKSIVTKKVESYHVEIFDNIFNKEKINN